MLARFVQFLDIPQRYILGSQSSAIWSHVYPKKLTILKKLDTGNIGKVGNDSSHVAVCGELLVVDDESLLKSRTLSNTYFNLEKIALFDCNLTTEMFMAMLSSNIDILHLEEVTFDSKPKFSDVLCKIPKATHFFLVNTFFELDENWTKSLARNSNSLTRVYITLTLAEINAEQIGRCLKQFRKNVVSFFKVCSC